MDTARDMTHHRPYKDAWSNDDAFKLLQEMSGKQLDANCVKALLSQQAEVEEIQRRFHEDRYG